MRGLTIGVYPVMQKKHAIAVLLLIGGALTTGIGIDLLEDADAQEVPLWTTVVENALPLVLIGAIVYASVWLLGNDQGREYGERMARWTTFGGGATLFFSLWVIVLQDLQGGLKPQILVIQFTAVGAISGIAIGYMITEVKSTRGTLERRRNWFQAVFENTDQATGLVEPDGTVVEINGEVTRSIGVSEDSMLGEKLWETRWFRDDETAQSTVREAITRASEGQQFQERIELETSNRRYVVDFFTRPVFSSTDRVDVVLVGARDVTKLVEQKQQLEVMNRFLRHNIRNRLAVIQMHAGTLGTADERVETAKRAIQGAATELTETAEVARRVNTLVQSEPENEPRELTESLRKAITTVEQKETRVSTEMPDRVLVKSLPSLDSLMTKLLSTVAGDDCEWLSVEVTVEETNETVVTVTASELSLGDAEQAVLTDSIEIGPLQHAQGLDVWYIRSYVRLCGGRIRVVGDENRIQVRLPLAEQPHSGRRRG